ncbi:MAG: RICIN domain-containing protein [Bacteroidaceae bacterium]|nr:RICIN domain-containing protein [Bacteroidaceae bacterium]
MKKGTLSIIIIGILIWTGCLMSCDRIPEQALQQAGENRVELEKVLAHFKDDPDPLKYRAAKFLIENMPYNFTYEGKTVEAYDSAYLQMADEPLPERNQFFKERTDSIRFSDKRFAVDVQIIKADYLIRAIDEACDTWRRTQWQDDYDEELFFNYVLPYRILNEPLSDWRTAVAKEHPYLYEPVVWSKRGEQIEAEDADVTGDVAETESASEGKMVMLDHEGTKVTYTYTVPAETRKVLFLRYTTTARRARVALTLNGKPVPTAPLHPANSLKNFLTSRSATLVTLKKGVNTLSFAYAGDTIGLDYLQVTAAESYNPERAEDFSHDYCQISNKKTGRYLTIGLHPDSLPCVATLKRYVEGDSTQLLRLDYKGYACWGISVCNPDSDFCLETEYCSVKHNSPVGLYHSLIGSNQKWVFLPTGDGHYRIMNKDSGLFLEAKSVGKIDTLAQNPFAGKDTQLWKIERKGKNPAPNTFFRMGSALSEALRIFDITGQYEWIGYESPLPPRATSLLKGKTGNCRDEADYTVYLCRSLGIPAAVDFTPHWGNRSNSHAWSVVILPDGKATPFYMGCAPADTVHYYHGYKKPKIFRYRFQLNEQYANDLKHEEDVPNLFNAPKFTDVTDEYYETTDVTRDVPAEYADKRIAYICVFDNRNWVPVFYGNIRDGKVTFTSMGRNIVYMAAFYEHGQIVPFGEPFLIKGDGTVQTIQRNEKKRTTLKLLRKYPFMGKEDFFNARMSGGRFQGANLPDFSDAKTFYTFEGLTNGNWYEIPVNDEGKYRYLRYIGPMGSHCNINELEFYGADGTKLSGIIIGTEGDPWASKETVFDGDILTGFSGVSPDGHWVGLKLSVPQQISKFKFIPRNDGNGVEIGDEYELVYWKDGDWALLGTQVAASNVLTFKNVPSGGLYVLRDKTKGHEERIFTYEKGEQVWW